MAYHRGGHAGAVAVSYSTNAMPTPLSPSRRYSSGSSGTTTSGITSSSSTKLSSYRSSSSFDRPIYYSSGSSSTSSSGYGTSHRSNYSAEYRRFCSPSRSLSVSSSSFSDTGTGAGGSSGSINGGGASSGSNTATNGRYSRDRNSETRETLGSLASSAADLYAKYSPAHYVPNISASNERNGITRSNSNSSVNAVNGYGNSSNSSISTSAANSSPIFGGNSSNAKILSYREYTPINESPSSYTVNNIQGRPPRAARKSPVNTTSLQVNNHEKLHQLQSDGQTATEVTIKGNIEKVHFEDKSNNNDIDVGVNGNDKDTSSLINGRYTEGVSSKDYNFIRNQNFSETLDDTRHSTNSGDCNGSGLSINNYSACSGFPPITNKLSQCSNNTLFLTNNEIIENNNRDLWTDEKTEEEEAEETLNSDSTSSPVSNERSNSPASKNLTTTTLVVTEDHPVAENAVRSSSAAGVIDDSRIDLTDTAAASSSLDQLNSADSEEERNESSFVKKGFISRTGTNLNSDNNSLPSTSRRGDTYTGPGNGSNTNGSNGIGNSSFQSATAQQNIYRGINDQIEGSPTIRAPRNRLQTPRDERCGLNGLRNIGNTCFMNSVIQCLSNTRPLLEYLVNEQYLADINTSTSGMKGALIKAFSQVIQELWEVGGDHVVNTASLKSQIQRFAPRFMGYSQQDAQEFLRYLLEGLHEDVNRVTVKPQPIHTDIPEQYTDSQKAAESWKRYLRNEDSTIVDVFVGQLRSSLHCTSCGHVSVTLDPFWDLSLPIPTRSGTVKLNQCLEHFTKEEVLDGDEKPTCSKCQMRRKCTKSFSIQKFPKILVIHLKRFSPMERFRGKLNTLVDFPLTGLDLGAFSAPRVAGCTYNLYGVANHSGTTYSGHYTAYCKHPYSGEWHEYNDSRVSSIASRSVVSSEGYVLFYEQQLHSSNL